jgi:hypothetical protein
MSAADRYRMKGRRKRTVKFNSTYVALRLSLYLVFLESAFGVLYSEKQNFGKLGCGWIQKSADFVSRSEGRRTNHSGKDRDHRVAPSADSVGIYRGTPTLMLFNSRGSDGVDNMHFDLDVLLGVAVVKTGLAHPASKDRPSACACLRNPLQSKNHLLLRYTWSIPAAAARLAQRSRAHLQNQQFSLFAFHALDAQ